MASPRVWSGEDDDVVAKRLRTADFVAPQCSLSDSEFDSPSILNFPQVSRIGDLVTELDFFAPVELVPAIELSEEIQAVLYGDSVVNFAASKENESAPPVVFPEVALPNCSLSIGSSQSSTESGTDLDEDCVRTEAPRRRFAPHSHDEMRIVNEGGRRKSKHCENWSRNTFDEWRVEQKIDTSLSIEELSEQKDLRSFVDLLARFILDARKRDGSLYPPGSINSLLRGVGRIIRARYNKCAVESSKPCEKFCILTDVRYQRAKLAGDEAVARSFKAGLGKKVRKSDCLTLEEEARVLAQAMCQPDSPSGLTYRFVWYCTRNFFIRAASEMRATIVEDFSIERTIMGKVLRYSPSLSKTVKADVARCGVNNIRKAVDCQVADVIDTYEKMISHRPSWPPGESGPHPLFLTALLKWKTTDAIWYSKGPIGRNTLATVTKKMTAGIPGLSKKTLTNKSGRTTGITRMQEGSVPTRYGMDITGHRDAESYEKYNLVDKMLRDRAIQRIISGEKLLGRPLTFQDAHRQELDAYAKLQEHQVATLATIDHHVLGDIPPNLALIPHSSMNVVATVPGTRPLPVLEKVPAMLQQEKGKSKVSTDYFDLLDSVFLEAEEMMMMQKSCPVNYQVHGSTNNVGGHSFSNLHNCVILQIGPNVVDATALLKAAMASKDLSDSTKDN